MAATLASAVVAHNTLNAAGVPLLDEIYVNTILVLVVVTCVGGPILSERFARRIRSLGKETAPAPCPPETPPGAPW